MNPIYLFISLVWGQFSTYLFYKGWISFIGLIYGVASFAGKRKQAAAILGIAFSRMTRVICHTVLLTTGFYLLYYYFRVGQTEGEALVYLISATIRMTYILPGASQAIDEVLGEVDNI